MADNITVPILYGEKEELYTVVVSHEEYQRILNGDQKLMQQLISKEIEKENDPAVQQVAKGSSDNQDFSSTTTESFEDNIEESYKESNDEKGTFNWPEKAVMLFLELYREKENEFNTGLKRHNKIWSEIATELQNANYNVSAVQAQNKMSSLKRTYRKIKDSNSKSGNHNSSWIFYSTMDSLFGNKSWVSPSSIASSDGPTLPNAFTSSSTISSMQSSSTNEQYQDVSASKPKKRKIEIMLDSFISEVRNNRDEMNEEKKK